MSVMNPLFTSMATLAVSTIYIVYSAYQQSRQQSEQRHERVLRERVAYMLWELAHRNV
jgi:hypothetical protein